MSRYRSLDLLRGMGVMLMVFLHGALYHYGGLMDLDLLHPPLIVTLVGFLLMWGGLFAVLSGATHVVRAAERLAQGQTASMLLIREWLGSAGLIVLGFAYFALVGPAVIDVQSGTRETSLVETLIQGGPLRSPSLDRWLYMNTLFMIGFSTLLVAPLIAWSAQRADVRSPSLRWVVAALAFLALSSSWLRIPVYELYEQAAAEGRVGFLLATFWLVNKHDPVWPALGFMLCGTLLGLSVIARDQAGRMRQVIVLGLVLLVAGVGGWLFSPPSMLRRSIDMTWLSITLLQGGVILLGIAALHLRLDATPWLEVCDGPLARVLRRFSRASLSVLFGETVLAALAARALDTVAPGWNLTLTAAVLFGIGSAVIWTLLLARWERVDYRGSVEAVWVRVMASLGRPSTRLDPAAA